MFLTIALITADCPVWEEAGGWERELGALVRGEHCEYYPKKSAEKYGYFYHKLRAIIELTSVYDLMMHDTMLHPKCGYCYTMFTPDPG